MQQPNIKKRIQEQTRMGRENDPLGILLETEISVY